MVQILLILRTFLTISLFFSISISLAQVGINTTNPADGSILDIDSSEKGILIPRVNITSLNSIAPITGIANNAVAHNNAAGLLVYNTNATTGPGFFLWDGSGWTIVGDQNDDWKRSGNAGTSSAADFIGTTDLQPLMFRTNNSNRFEVTTNGSLRSYNNGSQGQPSYSWNNSSATGMFRPANNEIGFSTASTERMRLLSNGQVSINGNPLYAVDRFTSIGANNESAINGYGSGTNGVGVYGGNNNGVAIVGSGFYGIVGLATAATGWAGYFNWDVNIANDLYVGRNVRVNNNLTVMGAFTNPSDRRIKTNIQGIDNALATISKLKPSVYEKNTGLIEGNNKADYSNPTTGKNKDESTFKKPTHKKALAKREFGLIAQDLELVLPELVLEKDAKIKGLGEISLKTVNYIGLIPILTKAIQEQQLQIESLEQRIATLEKVMSNK